MSKIWRKDFLICAMVIAGGIVSWSLHYRSAALLRETDRIFQQQAAEFVRLREEHARLLEVISNATHSASLSEAQFRDLLRSRNEVGLLRHKGMEMNQLQVKNEALLKNLSRSVDPSAAPLRWSRDQLANIGYADPESAVISTLWALNNNAPNIYLATLTPEEKALWTRTGKSEADFAEQNRKIGELLNPASATGISLSGKKLISPDDAIVDLYYEGEGKTRKFAMKRVNGQWRLQDLISIVAN